MRIGEYLVDVGHLLGKGAYGSVFKAVHRSTHDAVAMKQIEKAEHFDKSTLREIESLMDVKHPNIVTLLNVYEDVRCWWIVMEHCGYDLEKYLKTSRPRIPEKLDIMYQCASAISYLHNLKPCIVHRDIKLNNILLTKRADGNIVKVCDFGFSKVLGKGSAPMLSDVGALLFRAPELVIKNNGRYQYTESVDTFALGLVFKVILDYGCEGEKLEPTEVDIKNEEQWMLTYGMTLDKFHQKKKSPALFVLRAHDTSQVLHLKCLVADMTAYNPADRPVMKNVQEFLEMLIQNQLFGKYTDLCVELNQARLQNQIRAEEVQEKESQITDLQASNNELSQKLSEANDALRHLCQQAELRLEQLEDVVTTKDELSQNLSEANEEKQHPRQQAELQLEQLEDVVTTDTSMAENTDQGCVATSTLQRQSQGSYSHVYVLTAAIDLGMTNSSYAFAFGNSPDNIYMNENWGEVLGFPSYKTSTSVLTGPDGEFVSFGFDAEFKYSQMVGDEHYDQYSLFRHFKMMLYKEKNLTRSTTVTATNGNKMAALSIFSMALGYMKKHLLTALANALHAPPSNDLICWVLTVPAIWGDEAKQFIREAACKAGLIKSQNSKQLVIALEPEAVSIFCREGNKDMRSSFKNGTKYMVIDAGGNTIDIAVLEVQGSLNVKQLLMANGEHLGGTRVDQNFVNLLKVVLGDFVEKYQQTDPSGWWILMQNFEKAKKNVKANGKSQIQIQLSYNIFSTHEKLTGKALDAVINESTTTTGMSFRMGSLILSHAATINLFTPVITEIQNHTKKLLEKPGIADITHVMLVGGFAECSVLQVAVTEIMPDSVHVLIPQNAELATISGAVKFGMNLKDI